MARRVQVELVILFLLATPLLLQGQFEPSNSLVTYSFDDQELATGPDTFAIFEKARGSVQMTTQVRFSGYRSLEIRDVPGDGDFPELQGYFKLRSSGKLYLHFALMTATPFEEFNVALAGPEWFKLRKDGIGFWLQAREGNLYQYSDSMPKKLLPMEAFVWYGVDVAYDISVGVYDLMIYREGLKKPLVSLHQQANAPNQRASSVDKFSFIGDTGEDKSSVTYYVDDVIVSTDERIVQATFVAPGRRKLFVDYWADSERKSREKPAPLDIIDLTDLGVGPKEAEALKANGVWELFLQIAGGQKPRLPVASDVSSESSRLLEAVSSWSNGCDALRQGEAAAALHNFETAEHLVPAGKIFGLNTVLSLAALERWQDVDPRLSAIYAEWQNDMRFPAALAMIGLARHDLELAEQWLRPHAEAVPEQMGLELIRRVRSGPLSRRTLDEVRRQFPESWQDAIRDAWVAEQYFFVLLWKGQSAAAQQFARRMVDRYQQLGIPNSKWLERMGDAAVFQRNFTEALEYYASGLKTNDNAGILVKLSDVYFLLGDLENERLYREKVYGSLKQR